MRSVIVRPWVEADIFVAVLRDRVILGRILFELNNHLPNNLAYYRPKRVARNPQCFWYDRTFSLNPNAFDLRRLKFVVRDSDPSILDVIYVVALP